MQRFGVSPERTAVVLTPIDLDVFRPRELRDTRRRRLLFAGRLDDQVKRVSDLIRALALGSPHHSI